MIDTIPHSYVGYIGIILDPDIPIAIPVYLWNMPMRGTEVKCLALIGHRVAGLERSNSKGASRYIAEGSTHLRSL